jgi:hypothetical protein
MSLQVQHQQGCVRLTLDRPEVRDALNTALCSELPSARGGASECRHPLRRSGTLPLEEAFEMDQSLRGPLDGTANHQQALQAGIRC